MDQQPVIIIHHAREQERCPSKEASLCQLPDSPWPVISHTPAAHRELVLPYICNIFIEMHFACIQRWKESGHGMLLKGWSRES